MHKFFSVTEAARHASVSAAFIRMEILAGNLPASKIGSQWVITRRALVAWMADPRRGRHQNFRKSAP